MFFDTTGLARCDFYLDGSNFKNGNNFSQQVTAELVDASGTALAPPILFNATLSIAGQVAYDPSACAELSAASPPVTTVQEALDKLCESCHHEPGITIQGISWLDQPVGVDPLFNDSNVSVGRLAAGIRVFCSEAVDPMTISRPTCFVTLELPFPADAALGFQPLVLTAEVGAAGPEIFWKPTGAVAARLQSKLFAFRVLSATITSHTTVTIKYSQAVNLARATDSFNYTISGGVAVEGVTQVAGDPNSFMVVTSLLPGDVPLTLSISNIQAPDGSTLSNPVVRIPFFSEDRVLARFTLKGNFIWAASNPDLFLDGEAFGCKQRGVPMDVTQPRDPIVPTSNNSPPPEGVANAIDNTTMTKYLNFERLNTGFTVTPSLGGTLVTGLSLTSANDAPERDPATYRLE
ncbi:MAG TPA: hypothetical protein VNM37_28085, partial [Candidatus Dormibacteraeota bacterium]|nr:hypothetical protein [Candidatus Dormibacteraeota bacterium]